MHWDDDNLEVFITEKYPWFLDVYKNYDINIKRYDISRAFLLHHYGGIYADMDYLAISNFYDDLSPDKVSICESPLKDWEHLTNALMASPIKNKFWLLVIDECYKYQKEHVVLATGPKLITKTYDMYPDLVYVLPFNIYYPRETDPDTDIIKGKHLITGTWWNIYY